jgi:mono/diheme cytochrome c family protein
MVRFILFFSALTAGLLAPTMAADLENGSRLAREHCTRCHVVGDMNKYGGIGSTPSFAAIKTMDDWEYRFEIFYSLPPHPAVVKVEGITKDRPESLPAFTSQITLSKTELNDLLRFIDTLPKANF